MTTTETAPAELQERVREMLMAAPPARRAHFESCLAQAADGSLSRVRALGVIRQLGGMTSPAMGEDPRPRGRGGDGSSSFRPAEMATSPQLGLLRKLISEKFEAGQVWAELTDLTTVTMAQASIMIERLMKLPAVNVTEDNRATPGQVSYLRDLMAERGGELTAEQAEGLTKALASSLIGTWQKLPKHVQVAAKDVPAEIPDGIYRLGDDFLKVVHAVHGSGRQYAKKIVVRRDAEGVATSTWEMVPNAVRKLTIDMRVSLEEARQFGDLYGVCLKCGATLTDEESIGDMMGPYCSGKKGTAAKRAEALAYWA